MSKEKRNKTVSTGEMEGDRIFKNPINDNELFWKEIDRQCQRFGRKWAIMLNLGDIGDDIAQELHIRFLTGIGGQRLLDFSQAEQKKYIDTSAYHEGLKLLKEFQEMLEALSDNALDIVCHCLSPEEYFEESPEEAKFRVSEKYVNRLTALERKVYRMREAEGMSFREIGAIVNRSLSGVRKIYQRAEAKIERYKANER
jgi:DNA-directed RNA polymerase specialized sigma24 family protein